MDLKRALRATRNLRLALVGSGGKTTVLFQLARQLEPPVLLSASTHLSQSQASLADRHWTITDAGQVDALESDILETPVSLLTGRLHEPERTAGLSVDILDQIARLANRRDIPLLIEADGSRRKPLKAPAEHEPAVPGWSNAVCVVAGLSGLGQPLDDETVHRSDRFTALVDAKLGESVTKEMLATYLSHPSGGLKDIPVGARKIALLNQADTTELRLEAEWIANNLHGYDSILIASLASETVFAAREPAAGILLAAGGSTRFGQPKVLLEWREKPFIRHVAETAFQAGLGPVVVVAGEELEAITAALQGLPVQIAWNPHWREGQSTSLQAGLRILPENTGAAVFLLADQPQIPDGIVRELIETHRRTLAEVIAPRVRGRRGNPVLFDRVTFPELLSLSGDVGGRGVFSKHPVTWLESQDERLLLDIDTAEDYQALLDAHWEEP